MLRVTADGLNHFVVAYRPQVCSYRPVVVGHLEGLIDAPGMVVAQDGGDVDVVADAGVVFHRIETEGPVSGECNNLALGVGQLGRHGVGHGCAQMAQWPQPLEPARLAGLQERPAPLHVVAAVHHQDRVLIYVLLEVCIDIQRMHRVLAVGLGP